MKKREPGLDILRCMALFFVNGVHMFLYNGFYQAPQTGAAMWLADSLRWLFYCCIGIFLMLTGYLKSTKPGGKGFYSGLVPVLLGYVLTCAISFPIRHFLLDDRLTLGEWIAKLLTFGNYGWYVEMYIGLILLAPGVNLALDRLKTPKQLLGAAGVLFCVTALPSVTSLDVLPDYWKALYPFTYYMIGAVIRRLQPKVKTWQGLLAAGGWVLVMGMISVLSTDKGFSKGFTQGYGGFWVTVLVTLLFLSFYRVKPGDRTARVFGWMAGGCFEGYLLSRLFDVWVYGLFPQWHTPEKYPLLLLVVTVPVFLMSVLLGKAVHGLVERIVKRSGIQRKSPDPSCNFRKNVVN